MNTEADMSADRLANEARSRYYSLVDSARNQTEQAAGRVRDGKKPVKTLSKLGLELSSISHRATRKVLRNQTRLVENQLDALAGRLYTAARAASLRDLVRSQIRLIPQDASRLANDTRQTISAVAEAGGEVRELLAGTVAELRGGARTKTGRARTTAAAEPRPARKKAARKKKKKAAAKTATRKVAAKPAPRKAAAGKKATAKRSATPPTATPARAGTKRAG